MTFELCEVLFSIFLFAFSFTLTVNRFSTAISMKVKGKKAPMQWVFAGICISATIMATITMFKLIFV